ncbi:hypothetical protein [Carnobacterium pleistocenium]|uniref:hypothetical protein n=1 Tax=Carnobacterium pleistocenium TaxID=181073 RepID=UPI000550D829|nr:hypothetical protein [Carnobacterium pleistocenium]
MNLENSIQDVITKKMQDGTIEKIVSEKLEEGVNSALDQLFGRYGDVTEVIQKQIKSVMVPYLENRDYSEYIVKLDDVMVKVLKETTIDNKKILKNFKGLITPVADLEKETTVTKLFGKWIEYVSGDVDTSGLEIDYDDEPCYVNVPVSARFEKDEAGRSWSSIERATLIFECEHDEKMNVLIPLSRWEKYSNGTWDIDFKSTSDLNSLRHLNDFEVYMMNLTQAYVKLEVDEEDLDEDVEPEEKPEASFN